MKRPLLLLSVFGPIALAGLVLSVATHVAALRNHDGPLGGFAYLLHFGVFVVWFPAITAGKRLAGQAKDVFKAALELLPAWARYANYALFAYMIVNFLMFLRRTGNPEQGVRDAMSPSAARGFSGHWMFFYAAALTMLYAGWKAAGRARRCPNGHPVDDVAVFCETCGGRVSQLTG